MRPMSECDQCAICLFPIDSSKLVLTSPCNHKWDLSCISQWLEVSPDRSCPLCKTAVKTIVFECAGLGDRASISTRVFEDVQPPNKVVGPDDRDWSSRVEALIARDNYIDRSYRLALERRKYVYRNRLRACYIGHNKYTRFKNLGAGRQFTTQMGMRARSFIRRELSIFPVLLSSDPYSFNNDSSNGSDHPQTHGVLATSREIEFLTVYISSMLQLIDVQTAKGARTALNILSDYLGSTNASIFLHELYSFLSSPYKSVAEYDRIVQYKVVDSCRKGKREGEYGRPLAEVSEEDIQRNLRGLGTDILVEVPRAYSMKRQRFRQ
ncbi:hypothetical protein POJ06DRAFT_70045 [Lipomyces tetrasporus]|uniref:RING-type E3 ubiquitin transferase n=1 Tax=Lipomyces tetrasporus TaxID=54092 RepID=A0AAD7QUI0_9ASCO|nr:uncharacterized protein POJ06DRAFT_70045 [Lipomyces tetrasporus]KAJ8101743.1 hypothetical protein POJ06DRAFT_70045 [Lipomyces tetrasporus]